MALLLSVSFLSSPKLHYTVPIPHPAHLLFSCTQHDIIREHDLPWCCVYNVFRQFIHFKAIMKGMAATIAYIVNTLVEHARHLLSTKTRFCHSCDFPIICYNNDLRNIIICSPVC